MPVAWRFWWYGVMVLYAVVSFPPLAEKLSRAFDAGFCGIVRKREGLCDLLDGEFLEVVHIQKLAWFGGEGLKEGSQVLDVLFGGEHGLRVGGFLGGFCEGLCVVIGFCGTCVLGTFPGDASCDGQEPGFEGATLKARERRPELREGLLCEFFGLLAGQTPGFAQVAKDEWEVLTCEGIACVWVSLCCAGDLDLERHLCAFCVISLCSVQLECGGGQSGVNFFVALARGRCRDWEGAVPWVGLTGGGH